MPAKTKRMPNVEEFDLENGRRLAGKYEVISLLGRGWEGEVYLIRELATGIERAAKFFFPQRNVRDRTSNFYANKLYKLRHCPILVHYHTQERFTYHDIPITVLISDYVEGERLDTFLAHQPGKRLGTFEGLHLLYALAAGMDKIHRAREYHGDLHDENIIVQRRGIGFDLKILDPFHWGPARPENIRDDVCDIIRIFYDAIGGQKRYAKHPREIKEICCGLKRSLITRKFKTAGHLVEYLENMRWESSA